MTKYFFRLKCFFSPRILFGPNFFLGSTIFPFQNIFQLKKNKESILFPSTSNNRNFQLNTNKKLGFDTEGQVLSLLQTYCFIDYSLPRLFATQTFPIEDISLFQPFPYLFVPYTYTYHYFAYQEIFLGVPKSKSPVEQDGATEKRLTSASIRVGVEVGTELGRRKKYFIILLLEHLAGDECQSYQQAHQQTE